MKIDVLVLIKWLALAIALSLLVWWLFGRSPTTVQVISFSLSFFFLFLALEGRISTEHAHTKQTKVLYEIRDLLRKVVQKLEK